jgi:hypothetical protein
MPLEAPVMTANGLESATALPHSLVNRQPELPTHLTPNGRADMTDNAWLTDLARVLSAGG